MNIKKGDTVIIIAGKDKGKKGKVLECSPRIDKVLVDGIAMRKKHIKAKTREGKGEMVSMPSYIHVSNVQLIDAKTGKGTRVSKKIVGDKKVRISKKSGQEI